MHSQSLVGSPAAKNVLSHYFSIFVFGAIRRLVVSAHAFHSLWVAIKQFVVTASSFLWSQITRLRCVTWSEQVQHVAVITTRSTLAHKKRGLDAHCVLGVMFKYYEANIFISR